MGILALRPKPCDSGRGLAQRIAFSALDPSSCRTQHKPTIPRPRSSHFGSQPTFPTLMSERSTVASLATPVTTTAAVADRLGGQRPAPGATSQGRGTTDHQSQTEGHTAAQDRTRMEGGAHGASPGVRHRPICRIKEAHMCVRPLTAPVPGPLSQRPGPWSQPGAPASLLPSCLLGARWRS